MSRKTKKSNVALPLLFGMLIILLASLVMISVMYLDSEKGGLGNESSEASSMTESIVTSEYNSQEIQSQTNESLLSSETEISSSESAENVSSTESIESTESVTSENQSSTSSENIEIPLENANYYTKVNSEYPYYIAVNRKQNMVIIYSAGEDGFYSNPYTAFVCSTGLPDEDGVVHTPVGTFNTTNQYTWRLLEGEVYGQYATRIVNHILFHSVPYFEKTKDSLEWEEYNKLGEAASLGCIRLTVEDAKWIYDNCPKGTTVTIYDSDRIEPFAKPTADKIPEDSEHRGWDPTDPDPENPWLL